MVEKTYKMSEIILKFGDEKINISFIAALATIFDCEKSVCLN